MVVEEVGHLRIEAGQVLPRRGQQHGRGVRDPSAPSREELHGFVQDPRIGAALVDHGTQQLLGTQLGRAQVAPARFHPREVAADRVDLAVVSHEPEGLGAFPRRRRVRREPLMEDREPALAQIVGQIRIELSQAIRGAQRLVGDGAERERRDVTAQVPVPGRPLDPSASPERPSFSLLCVATEWARDDRLEDQGLRPGRGGAQGALVHRHLTPCLHVELLVAAGGLDHPPGLGVALRVHEHHGDTAAAPGGQETVGQRQKDTGAVSGQLVGGDRSSMLHAAQGLEPGLHDRARGLSPCVGDEADAAGIALRLQRIDKAHGAPFHLGPVAGVRRHRKRRRRSERRCSLQEVPAQTIQAVPPTSTTSGGDVRPA